MCIRRTQIWPDGMVALQVPSHDNDHVCDGYDRDDIGASPSHIITC